MPNMFDANTRDGADSQIRSSQPANINAANYQVGNEIHNMRRAQQSDSGLPVVQLTGPLHDETVPSPNDAARMEKRPPDGSGPVKPDVRESDVAADKYKECSRTYDRKGADDGLPPKESDKLTRKSCDEKTVTPGPDRGKEQKYKYCEYDYVNDKHRATNCRRRKDDGWDTWPAY